MKKLLFFIFLTACAGRDHDWDSGAQRQEAHGEFQRDEQVENTNMQIPTAGRRGVRQNQPF